jgi:hypothetical protein
LLVCMKSWHDDLRSLVIVCESSGFLLGRGRAACGESGDQTIFNFRDNNNSYQSQSRSTRRLVGLLPLNLSNTQWDSWPLLLTPFRPTWATSLSGSLSRSSPARHSLSPLSSMFSRNFYPSVARAPNRHSSSTGCPSLAAPSPTALIPTSSSSTAASRFVAVSYCTLGFSH